MPLRTACPIAPSAAERARLKAMAYGHKTEHWLRVRAQVVPHAARGRSNACVAQETGLHLDTVRRWRGRFAEQGLPGLKDRQRRGRPPVFTPLQVAEVKALARPHRSPRMVSAAILVHDPDCGWPTCGAACCTTSKDHSVDPLAAGLGRSPPP